MKEQDSVNTPKTELQKDSEDSKSNSNELHFTQYFQKNQHIVNALDDIVQARQDNLALKSRVKKEQTDLSLPLWQQEQAEHDSDKQSQSQSFIVSTDNTDLILQASQGSTQAVELLQQKLHHSVQQLIPNHSNLDANPVQNYQAEHNLNDLTHRLTILEQNFENLDESLNFNSILWGFLGTVGSAYVINFLHLNSSFFAFLPILILPLAIRLVYQLQSQKRQKIKHIEKEKDYLRKMVLQEGEKAIAFTRQMNTSHSKLIVNANQKQKEKEPVYDSEQHGSRFVHKSLYIYKLMAEVKQWNLNNLYESKNHDPVYQDIIDYLCLEKLIQSKKKWMTIGSIVFFCTPFLVFKGLGHADLNFNFFIEWCMLAFTGQIVGEFMIKKNKTINGLKKQLNQVSNKVGQLKQYLPFSDKNRKH
jgi:hypothetical protein